MIVIVGSRHDPVARGLAGAWPEAALCSAEDLVSPGWVWPLEPPKGDRRRPARKWVIAGDVVDDRELTGIFLRRSAVYPEELAGVHREDRAYLAAEAQAFLSCVLATTAARVVNPVVDGAFGEEALRPDRWPLAAQAAGLAMHPIRMCSKPRRSSVQGTSRVVEVVGGDVIGDAPQRLRSGAAGLTADLGLSWATCIFDQQHRLVTITAARPPGPVAAAALAVLLGREGVRA
jgi:hypothetical protein